MIRSAEDLIFGWLFPYFYLDNDPAERQVRHLCTLLSQEDTNMPSFDAIRPFKRARVNSSDDLTGCDHSRHDSDSSLAKSYTHAEGEDNGEPSFLKKTWKRCKRPG